MKIISETTLKQGHVCKLLAPADKSESEIVYLITSGSLAGTNKVSVVNLKDLQRNISHPENCHHITYPADERVVIPNSL